MFFCMIMRQKTKTKQNIASAVYYSKEFLTVEGSFAVGVQERGLQEGAGVRCRPQVPVQHGEESPGSGPPVGAHLRGGCGWEHERGVGRRHWGVLRLAVHVCWWDGGVRE